MQAAVLVFFFPVLFCFGGLSSYDIFLTATIEHFLSRTHVSETKTYLEFVWDNL